MAGVRVGGVLVLLAGLVGGSPPAGAPGRCALEQANRKLAGQVLDFTRNHGRDNRIYSPVLCEPRDLYVYLPPGYDASRAYSLVLWFHGAFGDEHAFLTQCQLGHLDAMISRGECPPLLVACPDGTYGGTNRFIERHSFYINGRGGRFEDHVMQEVVPFLTKHFSIRPERQAHGVSGISAGGFGALSLAIRRRDFFSTVAVIAAPVNMRYYHCKERYFANFRPATYVDRSDYKRKEVVGRYFGLVRLRASRLVEHAFGPRDQVLANVTMLNPADLVYTLDVQPGELDIYVNYPRHDNFNFDAQAESLQWLAAQKGVGMDLEVDRWAQHLPGYFQRNQPKALQWLCPRLLPPLDPAPAHVKTSGREPPTDP